MISLVATHDSTYFPAPAPPSLKLDAEGGSIWNKLSDSDSEEMSANSYASPIWIAYRLQTQSSFERDPDNGPPLGASAAKTIVNGIILLEDAFPLFSAHISIAKT